MTSQSFQKYIEAEELARLLRMTALDHRLKPVKEQAKQRYYHASLASYVAGWDNYVKSVVKEYRAAIMDPLDARYSYVHQIMSGLQDKVIDKMNTPNWENARNFLVQCTGYDPYSDWVWRRAGLNANDVQIYLNQILKVRHSFAHGFQMPAFPWNTTAAGRSRLSRKALDRIEGLFRHLVSSTDQGLVSHAAMYVPHSSPIW